MRNLITIAIILSINLSAIGQHTLGPKIDIGLSKITYSYDNLNKFTISGNAGAFYNYRVDSTSTIGVELEFVQLNGKDERNVNWLGGPPENLKKDESQLYTYLSYIGIPIYYEYQYRNLKVDLGVRVMYLILGHAKFNKRVIFENGEVETNEYRINKTSLFPKFNLGPIISVKYKIAPKFNLVGTYNFGLFKRNPFKGYSDLTSQSQQITIGCQYNLMNF